MTLLLTLIVIPVLIPSAMLAIEIAMAFLPARKQAAIAQPARVRMAILMPAHNEASGIADVLDNLQPCLTPEDQLLVVADNCTDSTASIARAHGATVIERFHETLRGKGFALDFGMQHLAANPPDVVIIIDADCKVEGTKLRPLAEQAIAKNRPVQALYLMRAPDGAGPNLMLAEFAWLVKNLVRPLGLARLGLPCPLMGSGMAFPWPLIRSCYLANGEIVEDLKLGLDLVQAGHPPLFMPEIVITSEFALSAAAQNSQRKRWEHGHLGMILSRFPGLLLTALTRINLPLLFIALDLAIPPLALLVLLLLAVSAITCLATLAGAPMLPLILSLGSLLLVGTTVLAAWWHWHRNRLSASTLIRIPIYVLRKIPNYLAFMTRRERSWIKTGRDR